VLTISWLYRATYYDFCFLDLYYIGFPPPIDQKNTKSWVYGDRGNIFVVVEVEIAIVGGVLGTGGPKRGRFGANPTTVSAELIVDFSPNFFLFLFTYVTMPRVCHIRVLVNGSKELGVRVTFFIKINCSLTIIRCLIPLGLITILTSLMISCCRCLVI
jgi:hypothetical protein